MAKKGSTINQSEDFPHIPGYKIKRKLGEGGMADVYLAFQENLEREVAIKILDAIFLKDEQILKRFKNEAHTAAKLVHPNIITIHDVGQSGDNHYIVMEYLTESLRDRIERKGKLPPAEALGIIKKLAGS
jgi:serine/threonine-protein kinase